EPDGLDRYGKLRRMRLLGVVINGRAARFQRYLHGLDTANEGQGAAHTGDATLAAHSPDTQVHRVRGPVAGEPCLWPLHDLLLVTFRDIRCKPHWECNGYACHSGQCAAGRREISRRERRRRPGCGAVRPTVLEWATAAGRARC